MNDLLEAAAFARAAGYPAAASRPTERRADPEAGFGVGLVRATLEPLELREVTRNGLTVVRVGGYASVTEAPYEMYDMFGPYSEVTSRGFVSKSLASSPLVEFTLNHGAGGGLPMAHTRNDTLDLAEDDAGFRYDAFVDPKRADVKVMLAAMQRGDLAEASFKFRITRGQWSPDYTEYRIDEADVNRGDVSAVNFGANPAATSGIRSQADPEPAPVVARATTVDDEWNTPRRVRIY